MEFQAQIFHVLQRQHGADQATFGTICPRQFEGLQCLQIGTCVRRMVTGVSLEDCLVGGKSLGRLVEL